MMTSTQYHLTEITNIACVAIQFLIANFSFLIFFLSSWHFHCIWENSLSLFSKASYIKLVKMSPADRVHLILWGKCLHSGHGHALPSLLLYHHWVHLSTLYSDVEHIHSNRGASPHYWCRTDIQQHKCSDCQSEALSLTYTWPGIVPRFLHHR